MAFRKLLANWIAFNEVDVSDKTTFFLTVEGGEGVGKSSFCRAFQDRVQFAGQPLVWTREPGGTEMADRIRALFLDPPAHEALTTEAELFLVSAARSQHVRKFIEPQLAAGRWVLCDRFFDSTRVYQGILGGLPEQALETCLQMSVGSCVPDLSFVLDCPVDIALYRLDERSRQTSQEADFDNNRFDQADVSYHEKLRQGFLSLAKRFPDRIVVLDASQSPDEVVEQAWRQLQARLPSAVLGGR